MGEAFRKSRAASFTHQRSRPRQALVDANLLSVSRANETSIVLNAQLPKEAGDVPVGSACCVVANGNGGYRIVYGNREIVSALPVDAVVLMKPLFTSAPALNDVIPCRVTRVGALGSISFEIGAEEE